MKKKYEVIVNDNKYIVELESEISGEMPESAVINGETVKIDIDNPDFIESILFNEKSYHINLESNFNSEISGVYVNGDLQKTEISEYGLPKQKNPSANLKSGIVKSQIAGKIGDIKKNEGDSVEANDIVIIIEAMKMENEIIAPLSGKIKEISVSVNSEINPGDQLFIVE